MIRVRGQKILESIIILMDLILGSLMIGCKTRSLFNLFIEKNIQWRSSKIWWESGVTRASLQSFICRHV